MYLLALLTLVAKEHLFLAIVTCGDFERVSKP